jgi:hypothetical protein
MGIHVAAVIELLAVRSTGTDTTLYVSTLGGRVTFPGAIGAQDCDSSLRIGSIKRQFGDADRPILEPGRCDVELIHGGEYDSLTPGGSNAQWWEGCRVRVYTVDATMAASAAPIFDGTISPRVLRVDTGRISFSADDGGLFPGRALATRGVGSFTSGPLDEVAGLLGPVAIGDFSVDPLPGIHITTGTNYGFLASDGPIGTVTVKVNGVAVTPSADNFAAGTFVLAAVDFAPGDTVLVYCDGRPADAVTGPVELLESLLTSFGGVDAGDIDSTSFDAVRGLYTGVTARRYYSEPTPVADAVAEVCRDHGLLLWRTGSEWKLSSVLPIAPVIGAEIEPDERTGVNQGIGGTVDQRQAVAHSMATRYRYDPSLGIPLGSVLYAPTAGPVYDASTTYPGTAEAVEEWQTLIDGADLVASAKLLGRYEPTLFVELALIVTDADAPGLALDLADVVQIKGGRYDGQYALIYGLDFSPSGGIVRLTCGILSTSTIGVWLDGNGEDGAGNERLSMWLAADGTDGAGSYIGTVWG